MREYRELIQFISENKASLDTTTGYHLGKALTLVVENKLPCILKLEESATLNYYLRKPGIERSLETLKDLVAKNKPKSYAPTINLGKEFVLNVMGLGPETAFEKKQKIERIIYDGDDKKWFGYGLAEKQKLLYMSGLYTYAHMNVTSILSQGSTKISAMHNLFGFWISMDHFWFRDLDSIKVSYVQKTFLEELVNFMVKDK